MRKTIAAVFYILLAAALFGQDYGESETPADPRLAVAGAWKEYWGVGEDTDVDYNDVYVFGLEDGIVTFACPERPAYRAEEIAFDGRFLRFVLINANDPDDLYIMTYHLELDSTGSKFIGIVRTNKGVAAAIILEKIEGG